MTIAQKVKAFFDTIEEVWSVLPGPVKVFIYITATMIAQGFVEGTLDLKSIVTAILINLGLYQIPRTIGTQTKKLL